MSVSTLPDFKPQTSPVSQWLHYTTKDASGVVYNLSDAHDVLVSMLQSEQGKKTCQEMIRNQIHVLKKKQRLDGSSKFVKELENDFKSWRNGSKYPEKEYNLCWAFLITQIWPHLVPRLDIDVNNDTDVTREQGELYKDLQLSHDGQGLFSVCIGFNLPSDVQGSAAQKQRAAGSLRKAMDLYLGIKPIRQVENLKDSDNNISVIRFVYDKNFLKISQNQFLENPVMTKNRKILLRPTFAIFDGSNHHAMFSSMVFLNRSLSQENPIRKSMINLFTGLGSNEKYKKLFFTQSPASKASDVTDVVNNRLPLDHVKIGALMWAGGIFTEITSLKSFFDVTRQNKTVKSFLFCQYAIHSYDNTGTGGTKGKTILLYFTDRKAMDAADKTVMKLMASVKKGPSTRTTKANPSRLNAFADSDDDDDDDEDLNDESDSDEKNSDEEDSDKDSDDERSDRINSARLFNQRARGNKGFFQSKPGSGEAGKLVEGASYMEFNRDDSDLILDSSASSSSANLLISSSTSALSSSSSSLARSFNGVTASSGYKSLDPNIGGVYPELGGSDSTFKVLVYPENLAGLPGLGALAQMVIDLVENNPNKSMIDHVGLMTLNDQAFSVHIERSAVFQDSYFDFMVVDAKEDTIGKARGSSQGRYLKPFFGFLREADIEKRMRGYNFDENGDEDNSSELKRASLDAPASFFSLGKKI